MSEEIPNSIPEVQPETQVGDQILPERCTGLLNNKMQCVRKAKWRMPGDISGREALCEVCLSLMKDRAKADSYTEPMERPEVIE